MNNLSIIIPCFNEDKNIFFLFEKIEKLLENNNSIEVVIFDNGSTDKTHQKIINSKLFVTTIVVNATN